VNRPFPVLLVSCLFWQAALGADDPFEKPPISYSSARPRDAITALGARMASGSLDLSGDERKVVGTLLAALGIPASSQMLVFSKTSFQKDRIDPAHPRAVYFSDEVYVGWCPGGLVEVAAVDPVLGPVFYSFDPHAAGPGKRFQREEDCLRCHGGTFVREIPGLLARSVFTDPAGQPLLEFGSELVDSTTPIEKRWGGWYVTAIRAGPRHRGNLIVTDGREPGVRELSVGANLKSLSKLVDTGPYLAPTSDVTALLVFEHQLSVQNALTRANQECLRMITYQTNLQRELKEPVTSEPNYESVQHVFSSAAQLVLDALLYKDEAPLPEGGVEGVGDFAKVFASHNSAAANRPSLKELDLHQRLFKYRCSYLIQSSTFAALQPTLRRRVLQRLYRVLTDLSPDPRYAYLEPDERDKIRQIIVATVPNLPPVWKR